MKQLLTAFIMLFSVATFAQKSDYNIGILLDESTPELEPVLEELKSQIQAVVGEDANIIYPSNSTLVSGFNIDNAQKNYETLLANETDIILAVGEVNAIILDGQKSFPKPTILFGTISNDLLNINVNQENSGIDNFTYLIQSGSYKTDLESLQSLTSFETVGIAVDQQVHKMLPFESAFDRITKELGIQYKLIPFEKSQDIVNQLEGVDALYLIGGFFLPQSDVKVLAGELIQKSIPSFTVNGVQQVEDGFLATNQTEANFDQMGRRIALTVERYINGTPLSTMPVFVVNSSELTVNYNTADLVNVPMKYSTIGTTNFVGEFKNVNSTKSYNLYDVLEQTLGKNLSLNSSKKDIELSEQDVKTAKSNYLPSVTASATATHVDPDLARISFGQNPEFSGAGNITLQQTIYSPGASSNIKIRENLKEAQKEAYNANELNTIFDASNAYFNVLILKTNAQVQIRNLELTKKNLQIAEENFSAGQRDKTDVLRFKSQMAQNIQSLVQATNQVRQGFIGLNQVMNNEVDREIDVKDAQLDDQLFSAYNYDFIFEILDNPNQRKLFADFLMEEAKRNSPDLKNLQYNLLATEENIKLNGSKRFIPTVALQGQYNYTFFREGEGSESLPGFATPPNDNYNVGLNLSLPILNRNQTNINKQTAIIQKDQLEINKENIELNLEAMVTSNIYNLFNQVSNIKLSKVSEEAAEESLELTQSAYTNGAVSVVQLIDAQNNYLNAQLARANATYNYLLQSLQLERSIGHFFLLSSESENEAFRKRYLDFISQ